MSTPIHVPLKADPCLENDVANDKADPLVCLQLNQLSALEYFFRNGWPYGPPTCVERACYFFKEVLATVVALFWQTGKGGEWQVIWYLRRPQKFMISGLCVFLQCSCLISSW